MSRDMTHPLIERATEHKYHGDDERFFKGVNSWLSDFGGVTVQEFLDAAEEVLEKVNTEALHPREKAVLLADWTMLLELAQKAGAANVRTFAVVSTYDPHGSFQPGQRVTWSGHFTREEADRALELWVARLNRPRDPMVVEEDWPVPLHTLRAETWQRPSR